MRSKTEHMLSDCAEKVWWQQSKDSGHNHLDVNVKMVSYIMLNKLLESAQALFAENGYEGTPVRAINRKAGLADVHQVFENRISQLSELLRRKSINGEVREMDFDAAAMEIYALLTDYIFSRIFHIKESKIGNSVNRKKLIEYQVHMWKNP